MTYDPTLGRFIQSDPIGLKGGNATYTYALSAPLTLKDPRGLKPIFPKKDDIPDPNPASPTPPFPKDNKDEWKCRIECSDTYYKGIKKCSNGCALPLFIAGPYCQFLWQDWQTNCITYCGRQNDDN
jgi:hypothetical protein